MKLTVIGCAGSMSGKHSAASSYLLQAPGVDTNGEARIYSIILDFGPGAMGQSLHYIDPRDLDALVFSHLHADHVADIVGMQVYRRWHPAGALPSLPVFAPVGGYERAKAVAGDLDEEDKLPEFTFTEVNSGYVQQIGPFRLEFFAANHTVTAYSVRVTAPSSCVEGKEVVFTYSGDTDTCPGVVAAAKDADLFLCEAGFMEGVDSARGVHLTGKRAGEVAAAAKVKQVVLTHIAPWHDAKQNLADAEVAWQAGLGKQDSPVNISLAYPGLVCQL